MVDYANATNRIERRAAEMRLEEMQDGTFCRSSKPERSAEKIKKHLGVDVEIINGMMYLTKEPR